MKSSVAPAALVVGDDNLMAAVVEALLVKQVWSVGVVGVVGVVGDGASGLEPLTEQPDKLHRP